MTKIRVGGTLEEIEKALEIIRDQFEILNESKPYSDRGKSKYYRVYLECEQKE